MGVFAEIPALRQTFRRPPSVSGTGAGRQGAKKGGLNWNKTPSNRLCQTWVKAAHFPAVRRISLHVFQFLVI